MTIRAVLMRTGLVLTAIPVLLGGISTSVIADTIRIGVTDVPASYGDPYRAVGIPSAIVWKQVFDALTEQDASGNFVPGLARSWTQESPLAWRFDLRTDVEFSGGRPFDAHATVAVMDWLMSDEGRATIVGNELRGIAHARAINEHTVVITTTRPDPILPNRLSTVFIVDMVEWKSRGRRAFAREPVGTGSYRVVDWQNANGAVELEAVPTSWRPPLIPTIEIYPLRDHASRFQAAISGQLHAAMALRPEQLDAFRDRGFTIHVDPSKQINSLTFDIVGQPDSPFADQRVRQALNYAVDVEAIADRILNGTAPAASQGSAPGVFGYNAQLRPYPHDPERARRLLEAAGYGDGFEFRAIVVVGTYPNDIEMYTKAQQDLAAVGVDMTLEATIFPDWIQQYIFNNWRSEAFSLSWNVSPYNDAIRPMEYFSCLKARPFFCDESLAEDIRAAATEIDPGRRRMLLEGVAEGMHHAAPSLLLVEYGHIWAVAGSVDQFELRDRIPAVYQMSID